MILLAKVLRENDAHVTVGVYAGPTRDTVQFNGELIFGRDQWDGGVEAILRDAAWLLATPPPGVLRLNYNTLRVE